MNCLKKKIRVSAIVCVSPAFIDCVGVVRASTQFLERLPQPRNSLIEGYCLLVASQTYLHNFGYITANALILYFRLFIKSAKTPLRYLNL